MGPEFRISILPGGVPGMTGVRVYLGGQQTFGSVTKVRSRYNKTFAELMDNLRGEAGRRLTALSGP